ncbi:hypothetical protein L6164_033632 [Bauhinia variegata]|uniref:Uncharacterized protein n=1 Tax=Bauhinia variegata TaxID=167791 RepID=A0ACB9KSC4_BAUVA|nr:hypothetical protein L6164_033632 [Bauhinia variegata]
MEVSQRKRDVQDRRLSIIDVSSADDSLIDPISGNSQGHHHSENQEQAELLYTPNSKKFEDSANKLKEWEQVPQANESFEIEKAKKNSKCNLRKSLAWDSAFFTSAGVLDPEELSSIIEGVEKDEKHALPGIQEDVYKSCESISTLASDSLTLESIEADLFEDIRASIQKSSKKSNAANGNNKVPSGIARIRAGESLKKVGMASRTKIQMEAPSVSKNPNASMQGSGKMTKKNPINPHVSQKLVATRGESSNLRQPKEPGKYSPSSKISVKRASLGDRHIRNEKDTEKRIISGRVSSVSKASVVGGCRGNVPKPTLSSQSSSGSLATTKTKSGTSTCSVGNASDNISKSFNSLKRKGAGTVKSPITGSGVRTPSRNASRNKTESGNNSLSGLMSVTKLSPSVSPASSISEWSSESSSTSMAKPRSSGSRTSLDSSSRRNVSSGMDTSEPSNSRNLPKCARTTSTRTVLPPAPRKPSGLRMPSPKMGYFDGVKSLVRSPRGVLQSRSVVPHGLPKHGAGSVSPRQVQNKAKVGKLQPARSTMSIEDTEPNNQKSACLIPFHGLSDVASQNVKGSSEMPVEVENKILHKTDVGNMKANETGIVSTQNYDSLNVSMDKINSEMDGRICPMNTRATSTDEQHANSESDSTFDVENSTSSSGIVGESSTYDQFNVLKTEDPAHVSHDVGMHISNICSAEKKKASPEDNKGRHLRNISDALTDGDHDTSFSSATDNVENRSPFHAVDKAPVYCQLDLINDLHPIKGPNNREDCHHDDKIDCLSRKFGFMDIGSESQEGMHSGFLSSQVGASFLDNPTARELRRNENIACAKEEESFNGSINPCLSVSPTSFDVPAYTRKPFALKNSFCNMDGLSSSIAESTVSEVKTSISPFPKNITKKQI